MLMFGHVPAAGGVSLCNGLVWNGPNAKIAVPAPHIGAVAYDPTQAGRTLGPVILNDVRHHEVTG
jgi:hypothetical protein